MKITIVKVNLVLVFFFFFGRFWAREEPRNLLNFCQTFLEENHQFKLLLTAKPNIVCDVNSLGNHFSPSVSLHCKIKFTWHPAILLPAEIIVFPKLLSSFHVKIADHIFLVKVILFIAAMNS